MRRDSARGHNAGHPARLPSGAGGRQQIVPTSRSAGQYRLERRRRSARRRECKKPVDQFKLPDYASYKVAKGLFQKHPSVDAILIQGRWRSVAWVEELERDSERSVISSTAASLWWGLRTLRMQIPIEGYGRLLR